jgi:glycosyltransferase involved in cell wall biosynthesis
MYILNFATYSPFRVQVMRKMPTISILLTVYNTNFSLVKRAIDSVFNQDFKDFELVLIDDGSSNQYDHLLKPHLMEHEDKITYLRHNNCGQSKSINKGVRNSNSTYITILDADDEFKPNHLSACLNEMQHADLIASTTETIVENEEDYFVPDKFNNNNKIHVDECILFATLFGKREVFANLDFQDMYAADAHFFEAASKNYVVKKVDLRTYIYYRNNPNSICSQLKKQVSINLS